MYTDYPFIELGDVAHQEAPMRKCKLIFYDGNKYCDVLINGKTYNIKLGYVYLDFDKRTLRHETACLYGNAKALTPKLKKYKRKQKYLSRLQWHIH